MNIRSFALFALSLSLLATSARAATLQVAPAAPQPGDILTVTIYPSAGEKISGIGMSAFDTPNVKFYSKSDGTVRAFVGLPFDRPGGKFPIAARVQTSRGEQTIRATVNARARYYPTQRITMNNRATAAKMDDKTALRAERALVNSKMSNSYGAPLWNGNWVVPARGAATSAYGRRRYVNGKWWGQHNGADVKAASGTPVLASNSGRVVLSRYLPALRGNCVILDHGCNVFSIYMHLSKRDVSEGQSVGKGQRIGKVGATGFVTGAHLHWEVRVAQEPVDPNHVVAMGLKF
ncbi:Murein DD-endopeptidase MepM and murein hydrolase activator NlpD, containing LysM domain [Abditibacterium utsteinense]|uniref:Murein DD-endopeptidase MepM and murein hydrolase activator NlpD, containing LysM domain n=1 Tax=Abditibacterium utsteinense TaxID=1960156 RepID=A0A2S8SW27_9BACT|nr:M23 family metallopeptidase [Abditibacterium utsteinense]PQV65000.1 Murein DD-endopeptidase MepM and murein hydrolase activator NlpD, containing LysM domain [Abditibacterium utsteinense]